MRNKEKAARETKYRTQRRQIAEKKTCYQIGMKTKNKKKIEDSQQSQGRTNKAERERGKGEMILGSVHEEGESERDTGVGKDNIIRRR